MTTGSSKRRRRSAADEGPSIYKCEQLLRMLEEALRNRSKRHASTDLVKFLGAYLHVRTEANGSARSASEEDENYNSTRFHSFCNQLAKALKLPKRIVLERITQGVVDDEAQIKQLCDHLSAASEHYSLAMSLIRGEPRNHPVTIRVGTTNLINMRVLPGVLENVRREFRREFPNTQLRFTQTILDSDELLSGTQPLVGIDAVLACCLDGRAAKIPAAELVAKLPLRCCLLRQRPTGGAETDESRWLTGWDQLESRNMVALASRRRHFDVPWLDIESSMESIEEVPTLLEAHARVAASDAWTLSYRELMDDFDEQRLEAVDLPDDPQRQTPWIVAVLPRSKRKEAPTSATLETHSAAEKQRALELLKSFIKSAFQRKEEVRIEAQELTRWLSRFPYSYHISDYAPKGSSEIRRTWFGGRANLEFTSNGNFSGVFTLGNPAMKSLKVRVFGRPIPHHNRTVWHLQWRSVDQHSESGTTNLVISKSELREGEVLVGSWMGRSSWMADNVHPSGGPFILHTQPGLTPRELRQIVLAHQNQCVPDLRQLSNELIPLTPVETPTSSRTGSVKTTKSTRKSRPAKPR